MCFLGGILTPKCGILYDDKWGGWINIPSCLIRFTGRRDLGDQLALVLRKQVKGSVFSRRNSHSELWIAVVRQRRKGRRRKAQSVSYNFE